MERVQQDVQEPLPEAAPGSEEESEEAGLFSLYPLDRPFTI